MKPRVLIKYGSKYVGKYVALNNFTEREVVSVDKKPEIVFKRAKEKGIKEPVIFFVPERQKPHIY